MPRAVRSGTAGFTLIEVLIAMSIMAIVAVMSWQGVDGIVRAKNITQGRVDQVLRASTVLAQWEQDLGAIQDTETVVPALQFDGAQVTLTRRGDAGLLLVVWSMREGSWFRWVSEPMTTVPALQNAWIASRQFLGNEAGQLKTLSDVTEWQVYFYRSNAWTNAQSSAGTETQPVPGAPATGGAPPPTAAPSSGTGPLPDAVRLVLSFGGNNGMAGKIIRDVAIGAK